MLRRDEGSKPRGTKGVAKELGRPRTTGTGVKLQGLPTNKEPEIKEGRFVKTYDHTDTGNAERLADKFGDCIRYVTGWGEYLTYTGTHWKRDTKGIQVGRYAKETVASITDELTTAKDKLAKWRKKSASKGGRHAMIDLLKHEDGIAIEHTELDRDPWLLNVENGTLNLKTGELKKHDSKDLLTKLIPIAYNPKAKAPRWVKFLSEVLPDRSVREFTHRYLGYTLTGDVSERMFTIFLGGGSNGKTAFVNAVEAVLGTYATTAAPTLLVAKERDTHPTELVDLCGKRLATISETRKGGAFDEERVKRLTGSDRLKARRMNEDFWEFEPTHKLLVLSNHKPRVKDATDSFWDRVAIVPFSVRIDKSRVDRQLGTKLREEKEGILAWLVAGCRLWREQGLAPPKGVTDATLEYRTEEDIIGKFLFECCVVDRTAWESTAQLMKVNKAWADALNLYQASPKDLAEKLKADPFRCTPLKKGDKHGWKGIKLLVETKFK